MKATITPYEAEIRVNTAWKWLMKTEPVFGSGLPNLRWDRFRRVRDRLRPYRLPLALRLEIGLDAMAGQKRVSDERMVELKANMDIVYSTR